MESEIVFLVQESPEGGYEASSLKYSIFTEADTLEELRTMVRDAVACHLCIGKIKFFKICDTWQQFPISRSHDEKSTIYAFNFSNYSQHLKQK